MERRLSIPRAASCGRFTMINVTENSKIRVLPIRLEDPEFSEDLKKKIAVRAYEIFERRGSFPTTMSTIGSKPNPKFIENCTEFVPRSSTRIRRSKPGFGSPCRHGSSRSAWRKTVTTSAHSGYRPRYPDYVVSEPRILT